MLLWPTNRGTSFVQNPTVRPHKVVGHVRDPLRGPGSIVGALDRLAEVAVVDNGVGLRLGPQELGEELLVEALPPILGLFVAQHLLEN